MGYFPKIKEFSFRNLPKAVDELVKKRATRRYKNTYSLYKKAERKLERLFDKKLTCFEESCSEYDLRFCRAFFKKHAKKLSVHREKDPIPEEEDMVILVSTSKQPWNRKGILSDDAHFTDYKDEIHERYKVEVIPMKELNQIMISWGWK